MADDPMTDADGAPPATMETIALELV